MLTAASRCSATANSSIDKAASLPGWLNSCVRSITMPAWRTLPSASPTRQPREADRPARAPGRFQRAELARQREAAAGGEVDVLVHQQVPGVMRALTARRGGGSSTVGALHRMISAPISAPASARC